MWSSYFLLACGFGTTSLSLEEQIHAELIIIQRSSLVYLTEATVGTRFHALLGVRSFIRKSSQEHLDCCIWWSVAGHFYESEMPLRHCCRAGFGIIKLSFSKRAGWPIGFGAFRIVKGGASRLVSWSLITTTLSAKRCSTWMDEAQVWSCARSRADRKLQLRKSILNNCTQWREVQVTEGDM